MYFRFSWVNKYPRVGLRNDQTVFQSAYTFFPSHQQYWEGSSHSLLIKYRYCRSCKFKSCWGVCSAYLMEVLIFISLKTTNSVHLSLVKSLVNVFWPFFWDICHWVVRVLHIFRIHVLYHIRFANNFSPISPFHCDGVLKSRKFLLLLKSSVSTFFFLVCAFFVSSICSYTNTTGSWVL